MRVAILGAGSWGMAVALSLSASGHQVTLWSRHVDVVKEVNDKGAHPHLFPDVSSVALSATTDIHTITSEFFDCVFVMVSSQGCRSVLTSLYSWYQGGLILGAKGIEQETNLFPHEVALSIGFPSSSVCAVSGPGFAQDVVHGCPTALSLACEDKEQAVFLSRSLSSSSFFLVPTEDILGIEFCGAIKNVFSIAAGVSDGLSWGAGARSLIVTQGLAEASRLAAFLGIHEKTIYGLSGLGDLVLTATSRLSRNWRLGYALGQGEPLDDCLASIGEVTEGLLSAYGFAHIAKEKGVYLPIVDYVCRIFQGLSQPEELLKCIFRETD